MASMAINGSVLTKLEEGKGKDGLAAIFSPENLERLKNIMYSKTVEADSYLFWDGDPAEYLYYVKSGRVKLTKTTDDGNKISLYLHYAGDMFGQIDPFLASTQTFNAEVIEDAEFGVIQKKDLETLLWQHGDLAIEFMKWMGMTHRMTQTKFRDFLLYGRPGALCSLLIRLSNSYGIQSKIGIKIDKKFTNTDMAEMIGATRESVNRMLNDMRKDEAISIDNGIIVIKNIDYLRNVCKCENCPLSICRV
jgi:CRP/FNR family cyclic AMP-dependent transcriptional regulator